VKVAYWNKDSLLVSDGEKCYLIELGKRTYREDREEIFCGNFQNILWQNPVNVWTEDNGVDLFRE